MSEEVRYPQIEVQLTGTDSNIFSLTGLVSAAMRKAGVPQEDLEAMAKDVLGAQSYREALAILQRWVYVS